MTSSSKFARDPRQFKCVNADFPKPETSVPNVKTTRRQFIAQTAVTAVPALHLGSPTSVVRASTSDPNLDHFVAKLVSDLRLHLAAEPRNPDWKNQRDPCWYDVADSWDRVLQNRSQVFDGHLVKWTSEALKRPATDADLVLNHLRSWSVVTQYSNPREVFKVMVGFRPDSGRDSRVPFHYARYLHNMYLLARAAVKAGAELVSLSPSGKLPGTDTFADDFLREYRELTSWLRSSPHSSAEVVSHLVQSFRG